MDKLTGDQWTCLPWAAFQQGTVKMRLPVDKRALQKITPQS